MADIRFPKTPLDGVPVRPGFRRYFASDNDVDTYLNAGWDTVKNDKIKNRHVRDQVVGSLHLIEIPEEKAAEFDRFYRGQAEHERVMSQLTKTKQVRLPDENEVSGEESVTMETSTVKPPAEVLDAMRRGKKN